MSAIITKKQRRYGGAERPLDWIEVKAPISWMVVGTNNGKDANDTLQLTLISNSSDKRA